LKGRSGAGLAAAGSSALSLGVLILATPAYVQAQQSSASDDTIGEVVVTGIRESLKTSQAIKQNAEQLVDSVTSQDIGALPDRSVSEALQRIPGLTLQRTNTNRDPARLASEGGGIFIRGLSWVRSETNGRDIFSANNGRDLSFEDISADLLAGVDVYKNPSAELIEGGVGGVVNLRTRLPFDSDKRIMAVSADYNYADLLEKGFTSANALYSDRYDTGIGKIGFLLSYSLGNVGNRTDSVQTGRFDPTTLSTPTNGLPAGTTVYVPNAIGWREIDWEQKRQSAAAAFQWAPNDDLTFTLQGLYAKADPHDIEYALGDTNGGYDASAPGNTYNDQNVITSGTIQNYRPTADTRYGNSHKTTEDYSLNMKYTINDRWALSGDFQYVTSHADVISMTAFTQLDGQGVLTFDLNGNTPHLSQAQATQADQSLYWWAAAMDHLEDNDAQSRAFRLDSEVMFDDSSWLKSFRFGVRGTNKDAITRQTGWNWSLLSQQFWGPNNAGDPASRANIAFLPESAPGTSRLMDYNNFFRGNVNLPGVGWFPDPSVVSHGNQNAFSILSNTETSGWGWAPLTDASFDSAHPAADNISGGVNSQGEETQAAYGMIRFAHGSNFGPMDGNIGIRLVKTKETSIGLATQTPALSGGQSAAGCAALAVNSDASPANDVSCQPITDAVNFLAAGTIPGVDTNNDYTDALPSLNLRWHLRDDLQMRFAVAKAVVRPTFSQMVGFSSLSYTFQSCGAADPETCYLPRAVDFATGTGGNPLLKPTQAWNYDLSYEWYFAPTGSLTFDGFLKDVKDYIFLGNEDETFTSGGVTQTFNVSRNFNGSSGKIKGFELAYQQFYDKLPGFWGGFGFGANYTLVDSNGGRNTAVNVLEAPQVAGANDVTLPLEGLSKNSYNVLAMYEKYGVSARLAYNWRSRFLLTTSAANINRPVWSESYGQLDGSAFYSITPKIKVGLQATNILNARTFLDVGDTVLRPRYSWTDTDRRIAIAIRAQF